MQAFHKRSYALLTALVHYIIRIYSSIFYIYCRFQPLIYPFFQKTDRFLRLPPAHQIPFIEPVFMALWDYTQRVLAAVLLLLLTPVLIIAFGIMWISDFKHPLFIHTRIGKDGKPFLMFKMRTMRVRSSHITVPSNSPEITLVGRIFRRFKIDEFLQLINVIKGDMLLIGPRPVVFSEWKTYSAKEKQVMRLTPGISDFASIFLSRMGRFLAQHDNPEQAFHQICKPIRSRLSLFYLEHRSFTVDLKLLFFNATNFISHRWTLKHMARQIVKLGDCGIPYAVLSGEQEPIPLPPVQ